MHSLTNHHPLADTDFIYAMRLFGVSSIAQVIDYEQADAGEGEEGFACPLLDQVRRGHHHGGKRPPRAVDQQGAQGDEGLAGPALGHDMRIASDLPSLADSHDRQGLGRIRWRSIRPSSGEISSSAA